MLPYNSNSLIYKNKDKAKNSASYQLATINKKTHEYRYEIYKGVSSKEKKITTLSEALTYIKNKNSKNSEKKQTKWRDIRNLIKTN